MVKRTMAADSDAPADPARSLALLWGDRDRPARKSKHDLSVAKIVAVGVALADEAGIEALSMRKVAQKLGVGAMSLYTYVPGKAELVEVMIDTLHAEIAAADAARGHSWRERAQAAAAANFDVHLTHPWLCDAGAGRAGLGPGTAAKYDRELSALDGIGLSDVEMDAVAALLDGHVQTSARLAAQTRRARARTGMSQRQWWDAHAPLLARFADTQRYPVAARVGQAAGEANDGAFAADGGFAFGLARILDGVAVLVDAGGEV